MDQYKRMFTCYHNSCRFCNENKCTTDTECVIPESELVALERIKDLEQMELDVSMNLLEFLPKRYVIVNTNNSDDRSKWSTLDISSPSSDVAQFDDAITAILTKEKHND